MPFEIKNGVLRNYRKEPGVTEVVIPDGVTRIGDGALLYEPYGCCHPRGSNKCWKISICLLP